MSCEFRDKCPDPCLEGFEPLRCEARRRFNREKMGVVEKTPEEKQELKKEARRIEKLITARFAAQINEDGFVPEIPFSN